MTNHLGMRCTFFSNTQRQDIDAQEIAFSAKLNPLAEPGEGQEERSKIYAILMMARRTHVEMIATLFLNEAREIEADQSGKK